jgi:6-phosphogluconolactonase
LPSFFADEETMTAAPTFRRFADAAALATAAADEIAARIADGLAARPSFSLVLAGGGTPRKTYEALVARNGSTIAWDRVHLFWGDERCVPPDDAQSNYAMSRAALVARVNIPPENVHRMRAEVAPPSRAADEHERELRAFFGDGAAFPPFDLVLLGVGEDGHTASLFPGHEALSETKRWVVAVRTEAKPPPWRLSLTLPALCAARDAMFLATGAGERTVVAGVRAGGASAAGYPSASVRPTGRLDWFVDEAAFGA